MKPKIKIIKSCIPLCQYPIKGDKCGAQAITQCFDGKVYRYLCQAHTRAFCKHFNIPEKKTEIIINKADLIEYNRDLKYFEEIK